MDPRILTAFYDELEKVAYKARLGLAVPRGIRPKTPRISGRGARVSFQNPTTKGARGARSTAIMPMPKPQAQPSIKAEAPKM